MIFQRWVISSNLVQAFFAISIAKYSQHYYVYIAK